MENSQLGYFVYNEMPSESVIKKFAIKKLHSIYLGQLQRWNMVLDLIK